MSKTDSGKVAKQKYQLIILDMDQTLYRFAKSTAGSFKTDFYKEIEQRGRIFIADKLSVPLTEAEKIRVQIYEQYDKNISIGLEREYNISRKDYFNYVWDISASKYFPPDLRLRILLSNINTKKVILTTAPKIWTHNALSQLGVEDLFDKIWDGEGDIRKPNPEAYTQILNYYGVLPSAALTADDEVANLNVARQIGMATVLVWAESKKEDIHRTILHIYELESILDENGR